MKKLKALEILDYYDYPLLFVAENEQKRLFLCMLVNESNFLEYLIVESSVDDIEQLKHNKKDIRSIFEQPQNNTYYFAKMNSETDQWFEVADISQQEVYHYFPERDVFLSDDSFIPTQESLSAFKVNSIQEVQKYITKYRRILEKEPDNFSAQLTLDSLERHKKDLEYQLEVEKEDYWQTQEENLMES